MLRITADTNALIRHYGIEMANKQGGLTSRATQLISSCEAGTDYLFISSMSILEIWANIKKTTENIKKFRNFFTVLQERENIRIVELNSTILKNYNLLLEDKNFKEHDRIIYAMAKEFNCDYFISTDQSIAAYVKKNNESMKIIE